MAMMESVLKRLSKAKLVAMTVATLGVIGYFAGLAASEVWAAKDSHEKRINTLEVKQDGETKQLDHISDRVDKIYEIMVRTAGK